MSIETGATLKIDVDPETNGGLDQAAALVTGVYPDGTLRLRVFTDPEQTRDYVGEDGKPYDYEAAAKRDQQAAEQAAAQQGPAQQQPPAQV